jgi:hypothetical protein
MSGVVWVIAGLVSASSVRAQVTCENYGSPSSVNSSACACPPGFGGATCSAPACGGNIFQAQQRPLVSGASSTSFGNVSSSSCACPDGWTGTGCNVCQGSTVCQSAFNAAGGNSSATDPLQSGLNNTLTCNTTPRVYAAGEMSCAVIVRGPSLLRSFSAYYRTEPYPPRRVSSLVGSHRPPHFEHLLHACAQLHIFWHLGIRLCPAVV